MHFTIIFRILGILLMLFSLTLFPPILVSLWFADENQTAFWLAFGITFVTGLLAWMPVHNIKQDLRTRDGFLVTALFWSVLGLFGSLPFMFSNGLQLSFVDAAFESLSGLTTTGATVITGLDVLPKSILYYRQQLQWLGGIGIIVIAVAILPMLGIGGMQLYRAETPGPVKDSKLTPRITETAKALFLIYLGLTIVCALSYWMAGMTLFDAICHAYATVAIGGFSTHDASIGFFQSDAIMAICVFFMVASGVNFALHFYSFQERRLTHYLRDPEFQLYIGVILLGCVLTVGMLYLFGTFNLHDSLSHGVFQLVSILTTTGFATTDFSAWPNVLPFMLFYFAFMGGCAGSTGGGIKVIRILLIFKQGVREIQRLIHPNAVIPIKVGNTSVSDRVVDAVWGFFSVYVFAYFTMFLVLIGTGLDVITAFFAVGACINNLGPGLGQVAAHYGDINDTAKWVLCFAMLLGRLEVFTLLVLFSPMFWKR
ncbi:potassium transporter [Pseudomaricurvus alkylphenolicus]|jgi:trk system potassium uptake protein TrkH|uniref:TrkH family potassium uptake protein n=1 Tax=Pseudomaricurvus alkylphenolicus TaxID=1306991 RepID=UPI0014221BD2|nr:TrkH family potassium uptake protein [Pseudomaricurvus alkylphenolicus]NIB39506.1 potassium transporter [Pseudomaricurvus alkylphenolicus]